MLSKPCYEFLGEVMELFDTTTTEYDANKKEDQCIVASIKEDGKSITDKINRLIGTINVVQEKLTQFTDFEGFLLDIEIYFADTESERNVHGELLLELSTLRNRLEFFQSRKKGDISDGVIKSACRDVLSLFERVDLFLSSAGSLPSVNFEIQTSRNNPIASIYRETRYIAGIIISVLKGNTFALKAFYSESFADSVVCEMV